MPEKPKSRIEEIGKKLYSTSFKDRSVFETLKEKEYEVSDTWTPSKEEGSLGGVASEPPHNRLLKKVLILSFSFFLIAVGIAGLYFFKGSNLLSANNVDISVEGPVSLAGGDTLNVGIIITNNNDAAIEFADLLIEYPEGSYASTDSQEALPRIKKSLGKINAHETVHETANAVLFGESNTEKNIGITLEFRLEGSNATLEKKKQYTIGITSSPVDVAIDMLKEANSGQEVEVDVHLKSNSNTPLKGLVFSIDYPFGFRFKSADLEPQYDNKMWVLGDLAPSAERVVKIKGVLEGQDEEEKIFRVYAGTQNERNAHTLGITYNSLSKSIFIKKPFLALNMVVDNDTANEHISSSGKIVRADVLWENNLPTKIIDGQIQVKFHGDILNRYSIAVSNGGFYRSLDDTIVWDSKSGNEALAVIEPGEKGSASFSFSFQPLVSKDGRTAFANPEVTIEITARGRRVSDTNVPEEINTVATKKIKVESGFNLASRSVYYAGPLKNTGPLPPKVNQETTYTVIWTITNSSNDVSSATVRTTLPTYVKWLGIVSPNSENVTYNEIGGEVVWNAGAIPAGTGINRVAKEVAFQVSFLPSLSQINQSPLLTSEISIAGNDNFTGTTLRDTKRALSIKLSTDSVFLENQGIVVQ
ncbi:MAG: hypothetical protein HZB09_02795 [Candidatus Yonathbacteria bacterium]|nr:hypothetical protein [Candidatus Yonathbacteria bacterium]